MTKKLIQVIQAQLRASAAQNFETVQVPHFMCFINPDDDFPGSNYAVPTTSISLEMTPSIDRITEVYLERKRTPRLEFLEGFAPALPGILESRGYVQEMRAVLMTCLAADLVAVPAVPGIQITELPGKGPVAGIQAFMRVQRRSFGQDDAADVSVDEAQKFRTRFSGLRLFTAVFDGETVGVGSLLQPYEGVSEIAGIATLRAYRRRGIAAALTAYIAGAGFRDGLECLFLSAGDAAAGRVYARAGFSVTGHSLAFRSKPNKDPE